jgi:hypothetical protein
MIAPDEVDERFRDRLQLDKPTKIEDLVDRSRRRREERERDSDGGNDRRLSTAPAANGFGVAANESKVPGFGPPEPAQGSNSDAASRTQQSAAGGGDNNAKAVTSNAYVDGVFNKHDGDKNGVLEGEELAGARGLPPNADADKDEKLTREELTAAVPSKGSSSGNTTKEGQTSRRSYRFMSAHERLNGSAKSWIVSRDKNDDGQVGMHEFSRSWSESKVREFQRYDQNGDGVITAAEYMAK